LVKKMRFGELGRSDNLRTGDSQTGTNQIQR
jgi:hypothetical protein